MAKEFKLVVQVNGNIIHDLGIVEPTREEAEATAQSIIESEGIHEFDIDVIEVESKKKIVKNKTLTDKKEPVKNKTFTELQNLLQTIFELNLELFHVKDMDTLKNKEDPGSGAIHWRWFDDENVYVTKEIIDEWYDEEDGPWAELRESYIPKKDVPFPYYTVPLSNKKLIISLLEAELATFDAFVVDGEKPKSWYTKIEKQFKEYYKNSKNKVKNGLQ